MSFYSDGKEDTYYERELQMEIHDKTEHFTKVYSQDKVLQDMLRSIRQKEINKENNLELLAGNILVTISKTKQMSEKQKRCLVTMLVLRREKEYI